MVYLGSYQDAEHQRPPSLARAGPGKPPSAEDPTEGLDPPSSPSVVFGSSADDATRPSELGEPLGEMCVHPFAQFEKEGRRSGG